jgi:hypothetical protein
MRSHQELLDEIALRKALGLPRIELTQEERSRAFGDPSLKRDDNYDGYLAERYKAGLALSVADRRRAKRYIKGLA